MTGKQLSLLGGPFGAGAVGDPNWQNVTLLSGTTNTNAGQNNTFTDSSSNNFTITRNGNTTQGSFSPFSQADGYWGAYFNGSSTSYIETAATSVCDQNQTFTFQCWIYPTNFVTSTSAVRRMYIFVKGIIYAGLSIHSDGTLGWYGYPSGSIVTSSPAGTIVTNAWQHIAIIVNPSSNYIKLYKNGLEVGTSAYAGYGTNGAAIRIGNGDTSQSTDAFNGYITNVKISQSVATLDYSATPIPSTTSGASILTLQSNRFIDSTANTTITPYSGASIQLFTPFGAPTSPYNTTNVGGSGYFDGSGDYLQATAGAVNAIGTGDFQISGWWYLNELKDYQIIFDFRNGTGTEKVPYLYLGSTGAADYYVDGVSNNLSGVFKAKEWTYVLVSRVGSTTKIFRNGTEVLSFTDNTNYVAGRLTLGVNNGGGGTLYYYNGYISGFRVVVGTGTTSSTIPTSPPTAITNTKALLNFTNANIYDQAADNDFETAGNAQVSTSIFKYGTSSAYFDGTDDCLLFPNDAETKTNVFFGSGEMTIEAWIYPTNISTGVPTIVDYRPSSGFASPAFTLWIDSGSLSFYAGAYSNAAPVVQGGSISINTWTHIAVNRAGGVTKLFVNGNQVASSTNAWNQTYGSTERLGVGATTVGTSNYFYGYISDLRITKGLGRYPYNFVPPTTSLPNFYQAQTLTADPYFDYTTLLLPGTGTNGAQNNTFLDSSTNAFSITRNGNTTQGTFSPFSQTGWSNYFNGTNAELTCTGSALSGQFTMEGWIYYTSAPQSGMSYFGISSDNGGYVRQETTTTITFNYAGVGTSLTCNFTPVVGSWYHIAVTRNSSNLMNIWINGSSVGSATVSTSYSSGTFAIGANHYSGGTTGYFPGYISNVRLVTGSCLYTASFTPSTTPLTAVSGTQVLTCQSNRFVDNSSNAYTLTVNGSPSVQAFSPFAPTAAYSAGTNGGSGYFDGSGDYLSIADNAAFDLGSGAFTLEAWIYPLDVTPSKAEWILCQWQSDSQNSWGFRIETDGSLNFYYSADGNNASLVGTSSPGLVANAWQHIAVVRNSNTVTIYVNGSSVASGTVSATFFNSSASIMIGNQANTGLGQTFTGYISSARVVKGTAVYTSAFTPPTAPLTAITNTSLLTNFTNAGITDATAKNDLETVGNAQISNAQAKWGSTSISLSASGNTLQGKASNQDLNVGAGDFTIEGWVYFTTVTGSGSANGIFQMSNTAGGFAPNQTNNLALGTSDGNKWQIYAKNTFTSSSTTTISSGTWYHFALCRYGSTTVLYINGIATITLTSDTATYNTPYLGLGSIYDSTSYPTLGYIQDFRVTKGIARYTQNFTPPTAAFQLL